MTQLRIIGLTGPKGCGKDTAADAFSDDIKFQNRKMAAYAKAAACALHNYGPVLNEDPVLKEVPLPTFPFLCPRQLVIDIANWARDTYGGEVHARNWERDAQEHQELWGDHIFVITDMRFPEELEMIRRHQSVLIYIERPEAEEKLYAAQAAGDKLASNVSESHYALMRKNADFIIPNNGTVEELHARVREAAEVLNGVQA
jgi:hypothetical protein